MLDPRRALVVAPRLVSRIDQVGNALLLNQDCQPAVDPLPPVADDALVGMLLGRKVDDGRFLVDGASAQSMSYSP